MATVHVTVSVQAIHVHCCACGATARIDQTHRDQFTREVLNPLATWVASHRAPHLVHTELTINGRPQAA